MSVFEPEILAMCCNWCGYAGADLAGVSRIQYPPNTRIMRIMCSGRVEINHLLTALMFGADGVMVVCCHPGDCHYVSGNEKAEQNFETTKELLRYLDMEDRVRMEPISAAEGTKFGEVVSELTEDLRKLGPNPMKKFRQRFFPDRKGISQEELQEVMDDIVEATGVYDCIECGKCAASCPNTRIEHGYSPMLTVERVHRGLIDEIAEDPGIWTCMTCGTCSYRCPSGVDYTGFIRRVRALDVGTGGKCSHGGVFTTLAKLMSNPEVNQKDRLRWVSDDLSISKKGDLVYFTGCLPYFDPIFKGIEVRCTEIARSTVRILNKAGITPAVMEDERCCGHDLLWSGEDVDMVQDLARINLGALKEAGAKRVVMSCPECYRTFLKDYPEYVSGSTMDFEVLHTSQLFAELIEEGKLDFDSKAEDIVPITYQDPCRLGRQLGVFDQPRTVLESLPGVELREMEESRGNAICCGTSAWMNCGTFSKRVQMDRLREAEATDARTLVTACPKCMIHFNCTLYEPADPDLPTKPNITVKDLSTIMAEAMGLKGESG